MVTITGAARLIFLHMISTPIPRAGSDILAAGALAGRILPIDRLAAGSPGG